MRSGNAEFAGCTEGSLCAAVPFWTVAAGVPPATGGMTRPDSCVSVIDPPLCILVAEELPVTQLPQLVLRYTVQNDHGEQEEHHVDAARTRHCEDERANAAFSLVDHFGDDDVGPRNRRDDPD